MSGRGADWIDPREIRGIEPATDAEIFAAMRRCADSDGYLAKSDYDKLKQVDDLSSVRIMQRFQTWNNAIEAAGLKAYPSTKDYYSPYTNEELFKALTIAVRLSENATGERLTYNRYCELAQEHGLPSGQTVRNRLGKWREIREMLGLNP